MENKSTHDENENTRAEKRATILASMYQDACAEQDKLLTQLCNEVIGEHRVTRITQLAALAKVHAEIARVASAAYERECLYLTKQKEATPLCQ